MLCKFILFPTALSEEEVCTNHIESFFDLWSSVGVLLVPKNTKFRKKVIDLLGKSLLISDRHLIKPLLKAPLVKGHRQYIVPDPHADIIYKNFFSKNELPKGELPGNAIVLPKSCSGLGEILSNLPKIFNGRDICRIPTFPATPSVYKSLLVRNERFYGGQATEVTLNKIFGEIIEFFDNITIIDRYCGIDLYKKETSKKFKIVKENLEQDLKIFWNI